MDHTPDLRGASRRLRRGLLLTAVLFPLITTGCQPAMSTSDYGKPPIEPETPGGRPYTGTVADWPLFFIKHNFGAHCFDTYGCRVLYDGFAHGVDSDDEYSPPIASFGRNREELLTAGHIGKRNFPPPAIVTWRSKDGTPLEAEIDIGEIFKDQLIRHNVPREEIPDRIGIGSTDIILEVNNRTINVYTRTFIPTKQEQIPGNQYSGHRNDLILVFSQTY